MDKKYYTKKTLCAVLSIIIILCLAPPQLNSMATDRGILEFDTTVTGSITESNDYDQYTITLPHSGKLSIRLTSRIYSVQLKWYDANLNEIRDTERIEYGSEISPRVHEDSIDLEAGTYIIRILKRGTNIGSYDLLAEYAAANNNEIEPNNTPEQAQPLEFDRSVRGFISNQDSDDYYKVTLTEAGRLSLRLTSRIRTVQLRWVDSVLREMRAHSWIEYGSESAPKVHTESMDLEAGTYYIRVHKSGENTGTYDLVLSFEVARNNEIEPNNTPEQAQSATLSQSIRGFISYQDSDDYYKVELAQASRLSLRLTSRIYSVQLRILNSNLQEIRAHNWIEYGSETSPRILEDSMELPAGTYYVRVHQRAEHTGTYDLLLFTGSPLAPNIPNNMSEWAIPEIIKAHDLGLIPDSLSPADVDYTRPITRAEFAGIAVRAYEILAETTVPPALSNPFIDTNSVDALKAYYAGLMVGVSSTEFAPLRILDRETAATALTRVYKRAIFPGWSFVSDAYFPLSFVQPPRFADDADISLWARESVYFMVANEIIEGIGDNLFAPRAVTNAQQSSGYASDRKSVV